MGVDIQTAEFLASEARRGVDFSRTLTLGRQSLCAGEEEYTSFFPGRLPAGPYNSGQFADNLFSALGAKTLDAIDVSAYENANIIHDLNTPFVVRHDQRWSCVFDGGALEHIFDFPSAIKSCMEATMVDGHFISVCPWTGLAGHGFYQFSPELLYRVLSPENGFHLERMLFRHKGSWREIIDPKKTGRRFEYQSKSATLLFVSARRMREAEVFATPPQQSDYVTMWTDTEHNNRPNMPAFGRRTLERLAPRLAAKIRAWREERRAIRNATLIAKI